MATPLPVVFRNSPLPSNFRGTPQAFADALTARLALYTNGALSLFVSGNSEPTSDEGPWLKDGITWWVWNATTGSYIPQPLEPESLKYVAQAEEPDPDVYTFWIQLSSSDGSPQAIKYYYNNAWVDIYATTFATFATTVQLSAAIAAINQQPFKGTKSVPEIVTGNSDTTVTLAETYDPSGVFDNSVFVAPVDGYYTFNFKAAISLNSGTPTGISIIAQLLKNGTVIPGSPDYDAFDDETGGRTLGTGVDVQLVAGDQVSLNVQISSTGSSNWSIDSGNTFMSGHRILSP
jgi:hypothetical protein